MLPRFAGSWCSVVGEIGADGDVVKIDNQIPHPLGSRVALRRRAEECLENPLGLVHDAEVARVARSALLVRRRHDVHEAGDAFEGPAPAVRRGVLGNGAGPRLGIEGVQALGKQPVGPSVFVQGLGGVAWRGHDDEGGVHARSFGNMQVPTQRSGD